MKESLIIKQHKEFIINEIAKQLKNKCTEHIKINGIRFYGISEKDMLNILKKYGYKEKIPF